MKLKIIFFFVSITFFAAFNPGHVLAETVGEALSRCFPGQKKIPDEDIRFMMHIPCVRYAQGIADAYTLSRQMPEISQSICLPKEGVEDLWGKILPLLYEKHQQSEEFREQTFRGGITAVLLKMYRCK